MIRKKLLASLAAVSLGIAAYSSLNAATLLHVPNLPLQTDKDVVQYFTTAKDSFFDYFEDEKVNEGALQSMPVEQAFQGPYSLMVSDDGDSNSFGMILASLGLMAVIVHRRRNI
jgi:hypothetical protein